MYIYLDDIRMPPKDENTWVIVRNFEAFKRQCELAWSQSQEIEFISFDHDLAFDHYAGEYFSGEKTGADAAKWLCQSCIAHGHKIPAYAVHSRNVPGAANIVSIIESAKKVWPEAWAGT